MIEVKVRGIPAAIRKAGERKRGLIDAMFEAAHEGLDLTADFIRAATPVMTVNRGGSHRYPGELRASVESELLVADTGRVMGRVFTNKEWAPFVEKGTREHGRARHMFQLGARTARPLVTALFEQKIKRALNA